MSIIYATATEHVNRHIYRVLVPGYHQSIHRTVELGIFKTPIYEPFDDREFQHSAMTIANMVECVIGRVSFKIINDQDVLHILHHIDAYVEEVFPLRGTKEVQIYIEKILNLRTHVYRMFRFVLNRHEDWKVAYTKGVGVFDFIRELYTAIGISVDAPATLISTLAICPTIRRQNDYEAKTKTVSSKTRKVSYGV